MPLNPYLKVCSWGAQGRQSSVVPPPHSPPPFITLALFVDSSIFYLCLPALLAWAVLSLLGLFPPDCLMGFIHRQLWWGRPRCPPCSLCYSPGWEVGRSGGRPGAGKEKALSAVGQGTGCGWKVVPLPKVCVFRIRQQYTPPRIPHYCLLLPLSLGPLPALWGTRG